MVDVGDEAPDFTAPLANGDVEEFRLADRLDEAPLVLVFFPGAFTGTCSDEMSAFQRRLDGFERTGASVYGVSVDTPFALNEFRDKLALDFGFVSDHNREIIDRYGLSMDFENMGVKNLAKRAVFVVDGTGTVTYAWVSDDPGIEPDYDEVEAAATEAA